MFLLILYRCSYIYGAFEDSNLFSILNIKTKKIYKRISIGIYLLS